MTSDLYFIINVFNVIIISIDNFICALLYAIELYTGLSSSTLNTIIIIIICNIGIILEALIDRR